MRLSGVVLSAQDRERARRRIEAVDAKLAAGTLMVERECRCRPPRRLSARELAALPGPERDRVSDAAVMTWDEGAHTAGRRRRRWSAQ